MRNPREEKPERRGREPACAECYCMKLKCVCKYLIIKEILVEATGVELITMLTARKLLILGSATRAKKAPLPDPLYVYCTKTLFRSEVPRNNIAAQVSHRFAGWMEKNNTSSPIAKAAELFSHRTILLAEKQGLRKKIHSTDGLGRSQFPRRRHHIKLLFPRPPSG